MRRLRFAFNSNVLPPKITGFAVRYTEIILKNLSAATYAVERARKTSKSEHLDMIDLLCRYVSVKARPNASR